MERAQIMPNITRLSSDPWIPKPWLMDLLLKSEPKKKLLHSPDPEAAAPLPCREDHESSKFFPQLTEAVETAGPEEEAQWHRSIRLSAHALTTKPDHCFAV